MKKVAQVGEMGFEMGTDKLIKPETNDTQPLTSADMGGAVAAAARREPISNETEIDRERGAVDQSAVGTQPEDSAPLFEQDALEKFRSSWGAIQTGFVDNPGGSVKEADELVAAVMKRLAEVFSDERANLEQAWAKGDDVSTEELRVTLRRYRSFFDRLLSV